jgi:hypothetical protein
LHSLYLAAHNKSPLLANTFKPNLTGKNER